MILEITSTATTKYNLRNKGGYLLCGFSRNEVYAALLAIIQLREKETLDELLATEKKMKRMRVGSTIQVRV